MHALQRHRLYADRRIRSGLFVLVANKSFIRQKIVLPLTRRTTAIAANAFGRVDQHSVACHHAPAFVIVTMLSCKSGAP